MSVNHIESAAAVDSLAQGLLDPRRARPWGVVSVPQGAPEPLVDLDALAQHVEGLCELYVIATGALTYQLQQLLPERCQVFGGASRFYPVGAAWTRDPLLAPLRFVHGEHQRERVTDVLIDDALRMAHEAGVLPARRPASVTASGVVRGFLAEGSRAMVQLDSGDLAVLHTDLAVPGVPLEWIFTVGQRVTGTVDAESRLFLPETEPLPDGGLLARYPDGTVTLGLVLTVERQSARIAVHPEAPITVTRDDVSSNRFDRVDLLLGAGDVVAVRLVRGPQGETRLRLSDIDDEEPIEPALALTPGGNPWLEEGRHLVDRDVASELDETAYPPTEPVPALAETVSHAEADIEAETDAVAAPRPGPGPRRAHATATITREPVAGGTALRDTQLKLDQVRAELARLTRKGDPLETIRSLRLELGQASADARRLREQLTQGSQEQRRLRERLRRAQKSAPSPAFDARRERFSSDEDWIQHEVYLAWIDRLDPPDRDEWPLNDYDLGAGFADSLEGWDDGQLTKAFKAIVDVVTGRARQVSSREQHPLREGTGAGERDVVRDDGARCYRVYVEANTASARRLHFWALPDGRVELSRVVLHDDVNP